ncbi:hypothetical protein WR25_03259 isoform M [Diploscapter pachys]|uniref:Neurotransmitter-gated ion-channel ligand-binding domain-containing protein n=1 Tax=Diploscapter pachys TaxID=2018661 RepID=A0A2A2JQE6_9BILA|nr:hypothetical protein WR25_03259 isoform M [Diploscapter pachys]
MNFPAMSAVGNDDEDRLMIDLFRGYNALVQPVANKSHLPMIVQIAMQLVLLVNVDEKQQVMHTNVWLALKWNDYQLKWDPSNYGGIESMRVAPDKIWQPDIVLFNNADGNYEVSFLCNTLIHHTGEVLWVPPAIYKSSCIIDVEYFPVRLQNLPLQRLKIKFDEQICSLTFGSWTYNREELKLDFLYSDMVDFSDYASSSIWDLIDGPAILTEDRSRVEFQIRIRSARSLNLQFFPTFRRKTLFYTVVLLLPTIMMAFLNVTVFYLPTASGEKMGLTMNVSLSIVVFLLLVSKILPPTSSSIPLAAKYLLLTFVLNVITIVVTTVICNIYFRSAATHHLPPWVRSLFLEWLPLFMCMKRPNRKNVLRFLKKRHTPTETRNIGPEEAVRIENHHPHCSMHDTRKIQHACADLTPDAQRALDAIEFITENRRDEEINKQMKDDWKYVSMVIDRFLLYGFFAVTLGGTIGIIASAPTIFETVDENQNIKRLKYLYKLNRNYSFNDTYQPGIY